jgi:hypothetical protein
MLKDIQIRLIKVYNIHERFFLKTTITLYAYMTETPEGVDDRKHSHERICLSWRKECREIVYVELPQAQSYLSVVQIISP